MFRTAIKCLTYLPTQLLYGLIWLYQYGISPLTPGTCRFQPTCSEYSKQVIMTFGIYRGSLLICKRLLRCHPFCKGGYDPLPSDNKRQ